MKILVIIGHQNIQFNSIKSLRGNTGSPLELEKNLRIGNRVSEMLRQRNFQVVQTDANGNDDKSITSQDFDLALSLHCDMDTPNDNGGGMVGSGDKSVDNSWQESARIKKVFDEVYFKETGIVNKNYVTAGMVKWYMWQYLSFKTPCVLIEMGQSIDPHDSVLLGNTELIASAIVRSICKAFNVSYEIVLPEVPNPPQVECDCNELKQRVVTLENDLKQAETNKKSELAVKDTECLNKIKSYKEKIINFINSI